ncbi:MAG: hypothetical protein K9W46_00120 [Candidatus Heimdallarchaeum endolithica]|uniref:50S ribosomal protein L29 n=1 Tax=Candidatus Heimdallarchaeum endolithica TaxID=2876572 RepID=A0A9Y1FNC7_9ARCH|nr:MAG: hypothetical protein K9W46_00120 [Candidatus Heimdallarchaeum endolithica]
MNNQKTAPEKKVSPADIKEQLLLNDLAKEMKKLSLKGLRELISTARELKKSKEEELRKKKELELEKAKRLLKAAGYTVEKKGRKS